MPGAPVAPHVASPDPAPCPTSPYLLPSLFLVFGHVTLLLGLSSPTPTPLPSAPAGPSDPGAPWRVGRALTSALRGPGQLTHTLWASAVDVGKQGVGVGGAEVISGSMSRSPAGVSHVLPVLD